MLSADGQNGLCNGLEEDLPVGLLNQAEEIGFCFMNGGYRHHGTALAWPGSKQVRYLLLQRAVADVPPVVHAIELDFPDPFVGQP